MFSVNRPSDVLVLNCWVTATKLIFCFSKVLSILVHFGTSEAPVIVELRQCDPAFASLTLNEGLGSLALRVERVKFLREGVHSDTIHPSVPTKSQAKCLLSQEN